MAEHPPGGHCTVARYADPAKVEAAIALLRNEGFREDQISVVKRGEHEPEVEEDVAVNPGDEAQSRVAWGAGAGAALGALTGVAVVTMPIGGPVLLAGPLALGATGGVVGAYLGGMLGWGVNKDKIEDYERRIEEGESLVIVCGRPDETAKAHRLLEPSRPSELKLFAQSTAESEADQ